MPKLPRGICPTCEEEKPVIEALKPDENGNTRMTQVIRRHKATRLEWADQRTWYCLGSREAPLKIVEEAAQGCYDPQAIAEGSHGRRMTSAAPTDSHT